MTWQPEDTAGLAAAIERCEKELPGWWWSVGACSVSSDATVRTGRATVGPDPLGVLGHVLDDPVCDAGFDCDLRQPSSCAIALNGAIDMALEYLEKNNLTPSGHVA